MSKHTPGPWRLSAFDVLGNSGSGNGMVCSVTAHGVALEEADANARLIAAAPDMLKALRQVLFGLELRLYREPDHKGIREDVGVVRAAIASAEGKE